MEKINGDGSISESKLQLKVGHYYKRLDGKIVGPVYAFEPQYPCKSDKLATYMFKVDDLFQENGGPIMYTIEGLYSYYGGATDFDLVKDLGPVDPRESNNGKPDIIDSIKYQINEDMDDRVSKIIGNSEPAKPKKRPLQVGDRVRVYCVSKRLGEIGIVNELDETVKHIVNVRFSNGEDNWFHEVQCKRLKPKKQKATNVFSGKTNAEIIEVISDVWFKACHYEYISLDNLIKYLGLGE